MADGNAVEGTEGQTADATTTPVTEADTSATSGETPAVVPPVEGEDKTPPGVRKRIDEITAQKHAERRAREAAEKEAAFLRGQLEVMKKGEPPPPVVTDPTKPSLDNYENIESFTDAMMDWKLSQSDREREARAAQATHQTAVQKRQATWGEQVTKVLTDGRYPDFEAVAFNSTIPISASMAEVMQDSEKGVDIAYYLGKNREEAARIAQLPPLQAARAIGLIEAKLTVPIAASVKVSSAPPPVTPISGKGGGEVDTSKMTDDEWHAHQKRERMKQFKK